MLILMLTSALAIDLPRTGQTTCYDPLGSIIACAGSGQDGEIQAGQSWPTSRFELVECDSQGPCAIAGDCDGNTLNDVVVDHLTGLMWLRDNDATGANTWQLALDTANNLDICGHSDWRLPNRHELMSLTDAGPADATPSLEAAGFLNPYTQAWTSTTTVYDPDEAFDVAVDYGWTDTSRKTSFLGIWPVRSTGGSGCVELPRTGQDTCWDADGVEITCLGTGQDGDHQAGAPWPSPRFVDQGDGSVLDALTGLTWLKDANCLQTHYVGTFPSGAVDAAEAHAFAAGLNGDDYPDCATGHTDWRIPNRLEILSLVDHSQINPALPDGHPFDNAPTTFATYNYWSSTSYGYPGSGYTDAWYVNFYDGTLYEVGKDWGSGRAWPVRGGILDGGVACDPGVDPDDTDAPTAEGPQLVIAPQRLELTADVGSSAGGQVFLDNDGDAPLVLGDISDVQAPFSEAGAGCDGVTVEPGGRCRLTFNFEPDAAATFQATVTVASNDPLRPTAEVTIVGKGEVAREGCRSGGGTCSSSGPGGVLLVPLLAFLLRRRSGEGV